MMETPKNREGRLTEFVMRNLNDFTTAQYNQIWGQVYNGLKQAHEVNIAIVPNNDRAFMAIFSELSLKKRKAIIDFVDTLECA